MKKNKKGFFLSETMVVIAVVAVVLLGVFKIFSSVYERFNETEKYNTVNAINALSNIQMYYENIEDIDVSELNDNTSYIELTNSEKYFSEYYMKLKEELNVKSIYLIDLNKYFSDTTLNVFNVSFRKYINTLKNINGVVLVIVLNNNEYASVELSNKLEIKLNGNEEDEYAVYVPVGGEFIDPGYVGWHGIEPEKTWENGIELDTTKEGNYYLHYNFNGYILRRKIVVGDSNGVAYITKLLSQEETLQNGLIQSTAIVNEEIVDAGIRYVGLEPKNKVYYNCEDTDGTNAYGSENYNYEESCEIWRIIGVFDTKSTNGKNETVVKRIKIVRDEMLSTKMEWDTTTEGVDSINQWGETTLTNDNTTLYAGASLMQYLNMGDSSYYNSLSSVSKEQISEVLWYTGALSNMEITPSKVYAAERSTATGTGTTLTYTTESVGKIGLIYPSDYGYAGGTTCTTLNSSSCGTNNWLNPTSSYWTILPVAGYSNYSWFVSIHGYMYSKVVTNINSVRPTTYLKSSIEILDGNGVDKPYILK